MHALKVARQQSNANSEACVTDMWRVERGIYRDFIPKPKGPSARSRIKDMCVKFGAMTIIPSVSLHQEYLTINHGNTSD